MTGEAPVKVLFIGGMGRSGSTLLDRMLGSVPGVVSIGEFRKFWRRGLDANELCGCGEPLRSCPFWKAVLAGAGDRDFEAARAAEDRLLRALKNTAKFRSARLRDARFHRDLDAFAAARVAMLRSVVEVSGASLVVDSSKGPLYGMALALSAGLSVTPVHLVRDGRAVAYSWSRKKEVRRTAEHTDLMPTLPAAVAAGHWVTKSVQMELGWPGGRRPMRVHYEDMVREPKATVRRLLRRAGHPIPGEQTGPETGLVRFGKDHTVLGNPSRFEQGEVAVRLDDEWRRSMPGVARATVTALSMPLLATYGYTWPGHRGRRAGRGPR
jgi:hypothetical protein